jgi:hypothetical protein
MALTGHLSDLSLSELIEFFCNQRKTGCLNVLYPQGHGSFYLQSGSVVDAKIGVLRGIDAVYFALTLPNAAFEFKGSAETPERSINQPWTQVVLEGLRRLDEGIIPTDAFPAGESTKDEVQPSDFQMSEATPATPSHSKVPTFLTGVSAGSGSSRKPLFVGAVVVAILASVVAIGVPAGWYHRTKPPVTNQTVEVAPTPQAVASEPVNSSTPAVDNQAAEAAALAAKRQKEKDRKAREERANAAASDPTTAAQSSANSDNKPGPKKVTVQVSYDESGRVTQASGGDATAVRIARQKHFPPGKAGSATLTISIN